MKSINPFGIKLIAVFCLLAGGLVCLGLLYYHQEASRILNDQYENLSAIAQLKADTINEWRRERVADVRRAPGPLVKKEMANFLHDPMNAGARDALKTQLHINRKVTIYADALFLDTQGKILLSDQSDSGPVHQATIQAIAAAVKDRQETLSELYLDGQGKVYIDAVAPVPDEKGRPMAVVVLRSKADDYLFPLIQTWPTSSKTAETLLVRREGDSVLFLNELRHRSNTALRMRFPLINKNAPAVRAVLGISGKFSGTDYRGIEVLSELRQIPQSPWFIIAKVDKAEVLAESRYRAWVVMIIVFLLIMISAGLIVNFYRFRQEAERLKAEETIKNAELKFRTLFDTASDGILVAQSSDKKFSLANKKICQMTGYTEKEILTLGIQDIHPEEAIPYAMDIFDKLSRKEILSAQELPVLRKDKTVFFADVSASPIIIEGKEYLAGMFRDITERKRAEAKIRENEARLRGITANIPGVIYQFYVKEDGGYGISYAGERLQEIFGITGSLNDLLPLFISHIHQEDADRFLDSLWKAVEAFKQWDFEGRFIKPSREIIWFHGLSTPTRKKDRIVFDGLLLDITDRKKIEQELQDWMRRYELIVTASGQVVYEYMISTGQITWGASIEKVLGYKPEESCGGFIQWEELLHPDDREATLASLHDAEKACSYWDAQYRMRHKQGGYVWLRDRGFFLPGADGRAYCQLGMMEDITEQKKAGEEIQKLASIVRHSSELINLSDRDGKMLFLNAAGSAMLGIKQDEVGDFNIEDVLPEHMREMVKTRLLPMLLETGTWEGELQYKNIKTGKLSDVYALIFTIADPVTKLPLYLANVSRDVSERKRVEEESMKLQEQLLQARKLEAVGVLAGGVAHDFNNILGVIIGYAELTMGEMSPGDPLRKNLDKILDAAQRSSNITRQLLAFARKQTIAPVLLNVNETVEAMLKMIRRLIGENIELTWHPAKSPCLVMMDPSQFDQLLLNLCVNARDAIGGIGKIIIEADAVLVDEGYSLSETDVMSGEYAQLSVSDNGHGMDKETRKHIFEPFFTTKSMGRGTGMGLSTVYGIIKQNKGFINVYSELGTGTTFKIYIPLSAGKSPAETNAIDQDIPCGQGETILLVEDDPMILEISATMLKNLGYAILFAGTPREALRIVSESVSPIHLLITDVVMPEMNGKDLAQRILAIRPQMKCLFMSGYTADIIANQGVLDEGVKFIPKPFTLRDLAEKVREALG